jgi:hypothetical protein
MLNRIAEVVSKETIMQDIFTCPPGGCNCSAKAETANPNWVVEKITEGSLFHLNHAHPKMASMTMDKIRTVILTRTDEG